MELKEAIEKFKNKRNELQEDVNRVEDYVNTLEDEEWIEAIDTVLEELNNRIPKKDIQEKLDYQYDLWNTPNKQKDFNLELVETLEDLLDKE